MPTNTTIHARSITRRGVLIGIAVGLLGFVGAVGSIYARRTHLEETTKFWGEETITALQLAEKIDMLITDSDGGSDTEESVQLSGMPGLGHLRRALLDERNFIWPATMDSPIETVCGNENARCIQLRLSDPTANRFDPIHIRLDLNSGWVGKSMGSARVQANERVRPALRHFLGHDCHFRAKKIRPSIAGGVEYILAYPALNGYAAEGFKRALGSKRARWCRIRCDSAGEVPIDGYNSSECSLAPFSTAFHSRPGFLLLMSSVPTLDDAIRKNTPAVAMDQVIEFDDEPPRRRWFSMAGIPAWLISTLFHVLILLLLGVVTLTDPERIVNVLSATKTSEQGPEIEEFTIEEVEAGRSRGNGRDDGTGRGFRNDGHGRVRRNRSPAGRCRGRNGRIRFGSRHRASSNQTTIARRHADPSGQQPWRRYETGNC